MKIAIADPPYPPFIGCGGRKNRASRWYGSGQRSATDRPSDFHVEAAEWDKVETHRALYQQLMEMYDGWAIATSLDGISAYGTLDAACRILIWMRPNAQPGAHRIRTLCEAVIVYPPKGRRSNRGVGSVSDFLRHPIGPGFRGRKPPEWTAWVLSAMSYQDDDEVYDLFPGSNAVSKAIQDLKGL